MKRIVFLIIQLLISVNLFAQGTTGTAEMADKFREDGKIYVVVAVALIVLIGILFYIILTERKLRNLEKELNNK